jgi:cell division protein FtsB
VRSGVGRARSGERKSAAAARRALRRGRGTRPKGDGPIRGAAKELRRFSRIVEQKFANRQRLRHLLLALAGLWALWTFVLGGASLPKLWSVRRQNAKLSARIEELARQESELRAEVQALGDPKNEEALERLAREEYGVVRDGEILVKFYEEDGGD